MTQNNLFVITKSSGITYEVYLTKLIKKLKNCDYLIIQCQIGCQEMTNSMLNDLLGVGEWVREYNEMKKKIPCQNKEDKNKKYEQEIYEYSISRGVHNQRKNV